MTAVARARASILHRRPRPLTPTRQRQLLVGALATALVEAASLLGVLPTVTLGRVVLSPSLLPALALLVMLGRRAFGRPRATGAAGPFWLAAAGGVVLGSVLMVRSGHGPDVIAVLLSALAEELVYRFAVPAVATAILLAWLVPARPARVAGFALAGLWFVLLPGHRAQMDDVASTLAFLAFAALAAAVVYRSGSLLAAAATHAVLNLLTILAFEGALGGPARGVLVGCLLVLLAAAYGVRRRSATAPASAHAVGAGDGVVIDLRDGTVPTVTDADGQVTPVLEEVEAPASAGAGPPSEP